MMRRRLLLAVLVSGALLVQACVDGQAGDACSSSSDCASGLGCAGPDDPPVCGIPARRECVAGTCLAGDRCHAIFDPCSPNGIGSECGAPCVGEQSCTADLECVDGACLPVSCAAGFECAAHEVCQAPSEPFSPEQGHGCRTQPCADDSPCQGADLACVNGACQTGPGSCVAEVQVP